MFTCPEGYAMFALNHAGHFEVLFSDEKLTVVCGDNGWKPEGQFNGNLPVCRKGLGSIYFTSTFLELFQRKFDQIIIYNNSHSSINVRNKGCRVD